MRPENAFHPGSQVMLLPLVQGPRLEPCCCRAAVNTTLDVWRGCGLGMRSEALRTGPVPVVRMAVWLSGPTESCNHDSVVLKGTTRLAVPLAECGHKYVTGIAHASASAGQLRWPLRLSSGVRDLQLRWMGWGWGTALAQGPG